MDDETEFGTHREAEGVTRWELVGLLLEGTEAPLIGARWVNPIGRDQDEGMSISRLLGGIDHSEGVIEVAVKRCGESYPALLAALQKGRPPEVVEVELRRVLFAFDFRAERVQDWFQSARAIFRCRDGSILSGRLDPTTGIRGPFLVLTDSRQHTILGELALPDLAIRRSFLAAQAGGQGFTEQFHQRFQPPQTYEGPIIGTCAQQFFRHRKWLGHELPGALMGEAPVVSSRGSRSIGDWERMSLARAC